MTVGEGNERCVRVFPPDEMQGYRERLGSNDSIINFIAKNQEKINTATTTTNNKYINKSTDK